MNALINIPDIRTTTVLLLAKGIPSEPNCLAHYLLRQKNPVTLGNNFLLRNL